MHLKKTTQAVAMAGIPAGAWIAKLRSSVRTSRCLWILTICALALGSLESRAAAPAAGEYEVKAAFLFNFAQYVEWPPEAFQTPDAPFLIGILGDDPFGDALDRMIRGETIKNHPIAILRSKQIENLKHCQLLFIRKSEKGRVAQIFAAIAGKHCLTVGETDRFANSGGIINFRLQGANVRFEINLNAAKLSELTISSKLLRLAIIVNSESAKGGN